MLRQCDEAGFGERLVAQREVYLRAYDGVEEARQSIGRYIAFYNARRPHAALDGRTPDQAYSHPLPLRTAGITPGRRSN